MTPYQDCPPERLALAALTSISLRRADASPAYQARVLAAWYPDIRAWPSLPLTPEEADQLAEDVICVQVSWDHLEPSTQAERVQLGREIIAYRREYPAPGDRYWAIVQGG